MALTTKGPKKLERHFKGVANRTRVSMLLLLGKRSNLTLDQIADGLKLNIKTASEHSRRLALAGLIEKVYEGRAVHHKLSRYGRIFLRFIDEFSTLKPVKDE